MGSTSVSKLGDKWPHRGGGTEAVGVLGETTDRLRLPLQPTISNGGALLTSALSKFQSPLP